MRSYRGLTKDGKWVEGWYVKCRGEHYILPLHNPDDPDSSFDERWIQEGADEDGWFEVLPETVGQFTGLHDKNGKDLDWWEGDLLQGPDGLICFIEYNHIAAGFYLKNPKYPTSYWYPIYKVRKTWKKIGTVHEHPALMENGK